MDYLKAFQRPSGRILSLGLLVFFLAGAGNAPAQQVAGADNAPAQPVAGADKDPGSAEKKNKNCVPEDPVNCANYATDVKFLNDGAPGCIVNPGVSKKCNDAGLVTKCPFSYGPYTCKTVIYDTNHNCKCACQG